MAKNPAAIEALNAYGSELLEDSDLIALGEELEGQSDRALAVVMGSMVERAIEHTLRTRLRPENHKELFGFNGPLGTFSNKILIGYALALYGKDVRRDLNYIRHIRNAAAHSKRPISFKDKIISEATALLCAADLLENKADRKDARDWFFQTCRLLIDAISGRADEKPLAPALERLLV
jgi:hypothetical protein